LIAESTTIRPMERRALGILAAAGVVACAIGWLALPGDRTGRNGVIGPVREEPTGVLLWLHDGTDAWPPRITALPADRSRAPVRVDLPDIELATDWHWSPDLSRMLWLEHVAGEREYQLVIGRSDGSSSVVVTQIVGFNSYRGRSWSPDGSRVAYSAFTDAGTGLWVVDAETGGQRLIRMWSRGANVDVDWSPDGTQLAVAVSGDGDGGVYTMDPDGTEVRRVSSLVAYRVEWSPRARTLVLEATGPDDRVPGIWVVSADGTGELRLSPPDVLELGPVWSPDGTWIAFGSERDREAARGDEPLDRPTFDTGIYLMRADGSDVRLVVSPRERGWAETWDWLVSWPPRSA
jgi:Tol biopolymer transport system component